MGKSKYEIVSPEYIIEKSKRLIARYYNDNFADGQQKVAVEFDDVQLKWFSNETPEPKGVYCLPCQEDMVYKVSYKWWKGYLALNVYSEWEEVESDIDLEL